MSRPSPLAGALAVSLALGACAMGPGEDRAAGEARPGKADHPGADGGDALLLATFNVEFFGSTTDGPVDDQLQADNVARILDTVEPDVIGLQEIVALD